MRPKFAGGAATTKSAAQQFAARAAFASPRLHEIFADSGHAPAIVVPDDPSEAGGISDSDPNPAHEEGTDATAENSELADPLQVAVAKPKPERRPHVREAEATVSAPLPGTIESKGQALSALPKLLVLSAKSCPQEPLEAPQPQAAQVAASATVVSLKRLREDGVEQQPVQLGRQQPQPLTTASTQSVHGECGVVATGTEARAEQQQPQSQPQSQPWTSMTSRFRRSFPVFAGVIDLG